MRTAVWVDDACDLETKWSADIRDLEEVAGVEL